MSFRLIVTGVLCGSVSVMGGCLITSENHEEESGVKVSGATLSKVQTGETTESWLVATLGEPTERACVNEATGVQILRYDHCVQQESEGTVLFLFAGDSSKTSVSRTYFEVTNGVVTRYWTEE
jgi:hypothetical protein